MILRHRMSLLVWLVILVTLPFAMAQGLFEGIAGAFDSEEALYTALILPITEFLKLHTPIGPALKSAFGKWGIIGLAIVLGVILAVLGRAVGIADMEQLSVSAAVMFGVIAGATGSGIRDFLASIFGGASAPPTDNNTTRDDIDRLRARRPR